MLSIAVEEIFCSMAAVRKSGCCTWASTKSSITVWNLFPPLMRKSREFILLTPYFPRLTESRIRHCMLVLPNASLRVQPIEQLQFVIKEIADTDYLFVQGNWKGFQSLSDWKWFQSLSDCPSFSFKESWSFSTISWRTSLSMQSWRPTCSRASEKWAMPFSSASLSSRLW